MDKAGHAAHRSLKRFSRTKTPFELVIRSLTLEIMLYDHHHNIAAPKTDIKLLYKRLTIRGIRMFVKYSCY